MTFQPVLPATGYTGWRFLVRTLDQQRTAYVESAPVKRTTEYFRDKIPNIRTAEDLVADRRLLEVALGAFGLDDDLPNRAFITRILADGTIKEGALANRLADKRYAALSSAFGFGDFVARTGFPGFAEDIVARYEARQFERAVGAQDDAMRRALNLSSALGDVLASNSTERGQWFALMGNPPLRSVVETALGLPKGFGTLDIDRQLVEFQNRARATFGTDKVADFAKPELQERIIRLFLIRNEAASSAVAGRASVALALLRGASA